MKRLKKTGSLLSFGNIDVALRLSVNVKEQQDKLPTMYRFPELNKRPYTARFIANSSACTTTELSKLLTSCLTAIKIHVISSVGRCKNGQEKLFWSIKNSTEVLGELKSREFSASSLSKYDFATLYTILPHN